MRGNRGVGEAHGFAQPDRGCSSQARVEFECGDLGHFRRHWIALLEAQGAPCSPIHDLAEAIAQPQVDALGIIQQVPGEAFTLTGLPLSIDGVRPRITAAAPALGSDPRGHGIERG